MVFDRDTKFWSRCGDRLYSEISRSSSRNHGPK